MINRREFIITAAGAVELGLGVTKPEEIEILTDDEESKGYAERLTEIMNGMSYR